MKFWTPIFLVLILCSCNDLNLKKQSADEILQEELKSINWKEVDFYPTFDNCGVITSKEQSKTCFETEIKKAVRDQLSQRQIITTNSVQDTVVLELYISTEGETRIKNIKISSEISSQNPELKNWLNDAISGLPEVYPAQKRSVPIPLHTQLPIILK
ncbi:hypothetical protein ACFQ0R_08455 [Psychroflexus salinarum]|uniref:TonB protein C-terminal n=1 Tax=Psychroflexus salinarum TaxID=546024 RepID=A0ABW3GV08_9FLAO